MERSFRPAGVGIMLFGIAIMLWSWSDMQHNRSVLAQSSLGEAWTCSADNIGATLTLACPAPRPGMRIYITDIIAQSTTSTGGSMLLEYGTGTNCGTGTTALLPAAATAVRIGYPALTSAPTVINLVTPLAVPSGKDVCVLGIATQTVSLQMLGRVGP